MPHLFECLTHSSLKSLVTWTDLTSSMVGASFSCLLQLQFLIAYSKRSKTGGVADLGESLNKEQLNEQDKKYHICTTQKM